jgi:hypothetical protein
MVLERGAATGSTDAPANGNVTVLCDASLNGQPRGRGA